MKGCYEEMAAVNYTLRIDEEDKQKAEQVFRSLGMTFSTGINVYIKTVGRQQKIPFALAMNEAATTKTFEDVFKAAQEEAKVNGTSEMAMGEIDAEIAAHRREQRGL